MDMFQEISDLIGRESAIKLGQTMGGARIYVPIKLDEKHPIALLLGLEKAQIFCHYFAGEAIDIPSKKIFRHIRNHCIRDEYNTLSLKKGCRADHLALKYGLSRRHILNILK